MLTLHIRYHLSAMAGFIMANVCAVASASRLKTLIPLCLLAFMMSASMEAELSNSGNFQLLANMRLSLVSLSSERGLE